MEFVVGNNDLDFYKFLNENGGLPDVITCCRFSLHDAQPLKDSLIESVNVNEGDTVHVGDVLMVYDTTSYQLTLQSDRSRIAVLEAQIVTVKGEKETFAYIRKLKEYGKCIETVRNVGYRWEAEND